MGLTGKKRSLTIQVTKTIANELAPGYPRTYYGRNSFDWNSVNYPAITSEDLSLMSVNNFNARLSAFKSYVQSQEPGLEIDIVQTNQPYF